jgi:hypothetical protein
MHFGGQMKPILLLWIELNDILSVLQFVAWYPKYVHITACLATRYIHRAWKQVKMLFIPVPGKVNYILNDIFYDTSANFFYVLTPCFTLQACVHRSTQHQFTRQMFSACTVQWYQCLMSPVNTTLYVQWFRFTCRCHFSKQFTTHKPSHFLQKYRVLRICFCSEHTWHHRCFPFEGQCSERFTSNRLSWDTNGLGRLLEMPLGITFSSCEWIINSRTKTSGKFFWVILPPHDLCIRNVFRTVMY